MSDHGPIDLKCHVAFGSDGVNTECYIPCSESPDSRAWPIGDDGLTEPERKLKRYHELFVALRRSLDPGNEPDRYTILKHDANSILDKAHAVEHRNEEHADE